MVLDHSVPLLITSLDFALSAILFNHVHALFCFLIIVVYMMVNAAVTLITNVPVYNVLTWKDWTTAWEVPA